MVQIWTLLQDSNSRSLHVVMARASMDWKTEPDTTKAAKRFEEDILNQHATGKPLSLAVDVGDSTEDREREILSFYKMAHVEWACPLTCTLRGDPAIGDGVTRHFFATIMSKLQLVLISVSCQGECSCLKVKKTT